MPKEFTLKYTEDFLKDLQETTDYIKIYLKNENAAKTLIDEVENAILARSTCADSFKTIKTKIKTAHPLYSIKIRKFYIIYTVYTNENQNIMEMRNFIYCGRNFIL